MDKKVILLSLSLDLKRITEAIQRNSKAVEKFTSEAKIWLKESKKFNTPNLKPMLSKIEAVLNSKNGHQKAEDCLMYSVLVQNQALYKTRENPKNPQEKN